MGRIALFAASSQTGRAAVSTLLGWEGRAPYMHGVRAVFRSEEKAGAMAKEATLRSSNKTRPPEAELSFASGFDAYDPPSKLAEAFSDSDVAILVTPHDPSRGFADDAMLQKNMMDAAVSGGVKHIVSVGSWTVRDAEHVPLLAARFAAPEDHLDTLGVGWTSIRAGFFNPNLANLFGSLRTSDEIRFPAECAFAPCDPRDVGRVAATVAADVASERGDHSGATYDVSGPELFTVADMAEVFAQALERPNICLAPTNVEEHAGTMPSPALEELLLHMGRKGASAVPFAPGAVKELTGEDAVSLYEWIKANKDLFKR